MTIDHVMIKVSSWSRAKAYYTSALGPLKFAVVADWGKHIDYSFRSPGVYVWKGFFSVLQEKSQLTATL